MTDLKEKIMPFLHSISIGACEAQHLDGSKLIEQLYGIQDDLTRAIYMVEEDEDEDDE